MKKAGLYFIVISIYLFSSCENKSDNVDDISIKMETNAELTDFIGNAYSVQLETNDEFLIGEIGKLCVDSQCFYIMDETNKEVYIFNKSGSYISKISRRGSGPNEYIDITDIVVRKGLVYILSSANKRIFIYDKNGNCQKTVVLNDWYHHIAVEEDKIILHSGKSNFQDFNIVVINHDGEILNKHLPFMQKSNTMFSRSPFNKISDGTYMLTFPYDSRIALLANNECSYKYKLNFNTNVIFKYSDIDNMTYEEIKEKALYKNTLRRINCVALHKNSLFLITEMFYDGLGIREALIKVNLNDNSYISYRLNDEINETYPYFSNLMYIEGDNIYSSKSTFSINNIDKIRGETIKNIDLKEIDNPVIWIYNIRW